MEAITNKINDLFMDFSQDACKACKGNKAAGVRARKTSLEIAKALKEFRAISLEK